MIRHHPLPSTCSQAPDACSGSPPARRRGTVLLIFSLLLNTSRAWAESRLEDFVPTQIHIPAAGITIPFDDAEDVPVVPLLINGEGPFRFLIDTGATGVVLDQRVAERLRLPRHEKPIIGSSAAGADVATSLPATVTSLTLGGARFSDLKVLVMDFTVMEIDGDLPVQLDGILGAALFSHTLLTLDYNERSLHLVNGGLPDADGDEIVPLDIQNHSPYLMVRLETASQSQDRLALIDTGSNGWLSIPHHWGLDAATASAENGLSMTASGVVADRTTRIARLRLGGITMAGPPVDFGSGKGYASIGQSLLEGMRVTFDFAGRRMRLQSATRDLSVEPVWSHGFSAYSSRRPGREGRIVAWVAPGSLAAQLLRRGDRVVMINGQSTTHMTNLAYFRLLKRPKIDLGVVRGESELQITLSKYDLLPWSGHNQAAARANTPESTRAFALYSLVYAARDAAQGSMDEALSFSRCQQAAELGDAGAQRVFAARYLEGRLVPRDAAMAATWFRRAAVQGHADSQYILSMLYSRGDGVDLDPAAAADWARQAADRGHAKSQYTLGQMFAAGHGVARDHVQALAWHRKSAEQGYADAQANLGLLHMTGEGVPLDHAAAFAWLRKAAEQGHAEAQANVGVCYANGSGVPRDYAAARVWLQKAIDQDYEPARDRLQEVLSAIKGSGTAAPP